MALMPVAQALSHVLDGAEPLSSEDAPLEAALGRVLAADLAALRTQPQDAMSAMDGYAVRAADVLNVPATLKVIGEVAAGHPFAGAVGPGEAARIFTGGVVPPGADAIVIQENTARDGDRVVVQVSATPGRHIRIAGLDFKQGDVLLLRGRVLNGRELMLAAAMNYPALPVRRRPLVGIIATGDELVPPGRKTSPGEVIYSNGFALAALAQSEGATVMNFGIAPDRMDATTAAIRRARDTGCDVLVTTGGASVGDYDIVQNALAAEGLQLAFWRIALRPGKPMLHGRLGGMRVLGLPGNPVSSYVCAVLFLVPLLRRLCGRSDVEPVQHAAALGCDLPANDEREDYLRATLSGGQNGPPAATPMPVQDSSMLAPLARADCLLVRPPHAPAAPAGSPCRIIKLAL